MPKKKRDQGHAPIVQVRVCLDGQVKLVERARYVEAKLQQLRAFGYATLTREDVDAQVDMVLAKTPYGKGLTIIGKFMENELLGGAD